MADSRPAAHFTHAQFGGCRTPLASDLGRKFRLFMRNSSVICEILKIFLLAQDHLTKLLAG
jgi:hypothetical protein